MTENEAIKILKKPTEHIKIYDDDFVFPSDFAKAYEAAIKALEEIQEYRAIGAVEELKKAKEQYDDINSVAEQTALMGLSDFARVKEAVKTEIKRSLDYSLKEYQKIGTVEEFKMLKENERNCKDCAGCTNWNCDCANVRAMAIDEFGEELNKKISEFVLEHKDNLDFASGISVAWNMVDEIAEQMKGR